MKNYSEFFLTIMLILLLSACGVGGVTPSDEQKEIDVSGNWFFKADVTLDQCSELENYENIYSVTLSQTENSIQVISPFGTFNGSLDDDSLTWSGQYFDEHLEKYLTFTDVEITVEDLSLSGSGKLELRNEVDGDLICSATFSLTGSEITESGEPPVAPELKPILAEETTDTTIKLRWIDRSINEDNFIIERSTNATSDFQVITQVIANEESIDDTNLTAETEYFYRIRAKNNNGDSAYSDIQSVITNSPPTSVPVAPTGLITNNVLSSSLDLVWEDNSDNEIGFNVERSDDQGQNFLKIGETSVGITTYSDTGLLPNTEYQYQVNAYNTAGNSANSNTATITTADTPPSAPTTLALSSKTDVTVQLSWVMTSSNEENIIIERSLLADSDFSVIATLGASTTSYQDTQLTAETNYFYRVKASNSAGDSDYSNTLSVTTNAPPVQPPSTPLGFDVVASKTELTITLMWSDVENESNYEVERRTEITSFEKIATLGADAQTYTDTNILNENSEYFYRIRATNTAGVSAYTDSLSASSAHSGDPVIDLTAIAAIDGLSVDLNWGAPDNISSIEVARGDTAQGPFTPIATLTADAVSYQDSTVAIGTTYYYQVSAINSLGAGNVTVSITTPNVPGIPQNFAVDANVFSLTANVSWDDGTTETGYEILISETNQDPFETVVAIDANATQATINFPALFTTYYVKMRAFNAVGKSSFTETISVQSARAADGVVVQLTPAGDYSNVVIAWTDSFNATNFRVERSTSPFSGYADISNGILPKTTLEFTDNTVEKNTTYYYRVYAINNVGETFTQESISIPIEPDTPSGFTVVPSIFETSATLEWDDLPNENAYEVQVGLSPSGFLATQSYNANTTSGSLTGLAINSTYRVRIRAINAVGASNYTAFTTFTSARVADAVTGLTGASDTNGTAVTLSWTPKANASSYTIQRSESASTGYTNLVTGVEGTLSGYKDASVLSGATYYYRIQSVNSVGTSNYVNSGAIIVNNPVTLPNAPTNVSVEIWPAFKGQVPIVVNWTDNATNESGYRISADHIASLLERPNYQLVDGTLSAGTEVFSYSIDELLMPTSGYICVRVSVWNAAGSRSDSSCTQIQPGI